MTDLSNDDCLQVESFQSVDLCCTYPIILDSELIKFSEKASHLTAMKHELSSNRQTISSQKPAGLSLLKVIQVVFGKFGCRTSSRISKDGKMEQAFPRQRHLLKVIQK